MTAFCQVVPTAVDLRLAPDRLGVVEFYGYDLDAQSSPVRRMPTSHQPLSSSSLDYMMTINVSEANGINFSNKAEQLIIRAGTKTLGTLAIIQKPAPTACGAVNQRCCGIQDAKPPYGASLECPRARRSRSTWCRAAICAGIAAPPTPTTGQAAP